MKIYPAIDIRHGKAVRLTQGQSESAKVYGDPVEMAERWISQGAEALHVVNLDGAFDREITDAQVKLLSRITKLGVPVQVGGGIRSLDDVARLFDVGVAYAILGSAAIKDAGLVRSACEQYPGKIIIGIDAKNGMVHIHGWTNQTDARATDIAAAMREIGVGRIIYTDIARDGMLQGANIDETKRLVDQFDGHMEIIGSGGIGSLEDVAAFRGAGCYGAIVGKALYEGMFTLEEAIGVAEHG